MLQLRIFFVANVAFTCFFVENVVITRFLTLNFTQNFWKKSSEIRRILAENLRKKLAVGASGGDCDQAALPAILPLPHERKCSHASVEEPWWGYAGPRNCWHRVTLLYWPDQSSLVPFPSVIKGQHTKYGRFNASEWPQMPQKWVNTIPFGPGHTLGTLNHDLGP